MRLNYQAALPPAERALELREKLSVLLRNDTGVLPQSDGQLQRGGRSVPARPVSVVPVERAIECYERAAAISERLAQGDPADRPRNISLPSALSAWRLSTRNAMTLRLR